MRELFLEEQRVPSNLQYVTSAGHDGCGWVSFRGFGFGFTRIDQPRCALFIPQSETGYLLAIEQTGLLFVTVILVSHVCNYDKRC